MLLDHEIQISPAEWQRWKDHPTTKLVFEALMRERSMWVEDLAFGRTLQTVGAEIRDTALAAGISQGISYVLEGLELYLSRQWEEAAERKRQMEEGVEYEY